MQSYILTAFGADQPGLVSTLSGLIQENGGNIEESRMLKMGNQFVMTVLISLTEIESQKLKSNLKNYKSLQIQMHPTKKMESNQVTNSKIFKLYGADNEGIVHSITKKLALNKINIIELKTYIELAPISATPLFNLNATIELPLNLDEQKLEEILNNHSIALGVNIELVN
jgi:glycine cleavage system transcriptional repressor